MRFVKIIKYKSHFSFMSDSKQDAYTRQTASSKPYYAAVQAQRRDSNGGIIVIIDKVLALLVAN